MGRLRREDVLDFIAYLLIAGMILWFILKATGIIKTPLWFELLPLPFLAVTIGLMYGKIDRTQELIEGEEFRDIPLKQAVREIEYYTKHKKKSFWMEDIINDLKIEPRTVMKALNELEKKGKVKPVSK